MNYTKGEWAIHKNHNWVLNKDGRVIANCTGYDRDEGKANCNLIAQAPAMYEALKTIIGYAEELRRNFEAENGATADTYFQEMDKAKEALAKAEGKA